MEFSLLGGPEMVVFHLFFFSSCVTLYTALTNYCCKVLVNLCSKDKRFLDLSLTFQETKSLASKTPNP